MHLENEHKLQLYSATNNFYWLKIFNKTTDKCSVIYLGFVEYTLCKYQKLEMFIY